MLTILSAAKNSSNVYELVETSFDTILAVQAALEMVGYSPKQVLGKHCPSLAIEDKLRHRGAELGAIASVGDLIQPD